ncbi:DNA ligase D [Nostocales cyanobacterium LEGE 12452]|nr:DNA ligase D [Nostocales cyanobacterium LEGE 12452]
MVKKQKKSSRMPQSVSPMLCKLISEIPKDPAYIFENKWDGYRIVSFINGESVKMASRSGLDYTKRYPLIGKALRELGHGAVIDGEVVVLNEEGKPDFDALQLYNGHSTPIRYCVFDLLWLEGNDLMELPLESRKELLKTLCEGSDILQYSESFEDGNQLYQSAIDNNLEGIVAKDRYSPYKPGDRGSSWLKLPTRKRQEFVIGGWAESDRGRSFRSLLFGAYKDGQLEWIGRSGGGYKEKEMPAILKQLKELEVSESPFTNPVLDAKGAKLHWVKPELVANFEFATWTKSGRIRKPATFLGFRSDKNPTQVVREVPAELMSESGGAEQALSDDHMQAPKYLNKDSNWKRVDESWAGKPVDDFPLEHCTIRLHDVERELWKGIAKANLVMYYHRMVPFILPYIKDRPQSLSLKLTHAGGPRTFIKDMENRAPECATVFTDQRRVKKPGKRSQIDYLVCNNEETLLFMVDLGCVDINPWSSRISSPLLPDYLWLDLDPTVGEGGVDENKGFQMAVEVAMAAHQVLSKNKLKAFPKTSGKTGLHIYIPCSGLDFHQARERANELADQIHELVPDISTRSEGISNRKGKVYIDANQNDYADTLAAPYCIRPYHEPLVSTPLDWKEVKPGLDRYAFNLKTIEARLAKKGDLFFELLPVK